MSDVQDAFNRWVAGVTINGEPITANNREYGFAIGAFYSGWHLHKRSLNEPGWLADVHDTSVDTATITDAADNLNQRLEG